MEISNNTHNFFLFSYTDAIKVKKSKKTLLRAFQEEKSNIITMPKGIEIVKSKIIHPFIFCFINSFKLKSPFFVLDRRIFLPYRNNCFS